MKKSTTNRRTGSRNQHKSLLQDTKIVFENEEELFEWVKQTKTPDLVSMVNSEIEYAKSIFSDRGILLEDTSPRNLTILAREYDDIPGVKAAVYMLEELARFQAAAGRNEIQSAYVHLLLSGQYSRQVQYAKTEPQYLAGASRTTDAHEAKRQQGSAARQDTKARYLNFHNELTAKGCKTDSKRQIYRLIEKETGLPLTTIESRLKGDKTLPT